MNNAPNLAEMTDAASAQAPQTPPTGRARSALEGTLIRVLSTLGWRRADAVFDSALPADAPVDTLDEAVLMLSLLESPASVETGLPREWREGLDGAVLAQSKGQVCAIVRINGIETMLSSDGQDAKQIARIVRGAHEVLFIRKMDAPEGERLFQHRLKAAIGRTFRRGLFLSFFVNVFAVMIPIFTMTIFDRVIGARAPESLWPLIAGAAIVVLCVLLLRRARGRLLAAQYARLSAVAGSAAEIRLLRTGFHQMQRQSIERIDARIGSVRRIAELFASSNTPAVFDAPFILVSIAVIGYLGGILAIVPAVYLVLFVLVAFALSQTGRNADPELAQATAERNGLLHELSAHGPEIRGAGIAPAWLGKFAETSRLAAHASNRNAVRSAMVQSLGAVLGTGAALVTLIVGVDLALTGAITSGALVATMLLTWRITGPAQGFFLGLPRLRAALRAIQSLDQTLNIPMITTPVVAMEKAPHSAPSVEAAGLYFRYDSDAEPSLTGVSFQAAPGSVTAVIGPNGAGKTTLLRILAGTLTPQSGQLRLNAINIRQYDPDELSISSVIRPSVAAQDPVFGNAADGLPSDLWTGSALSEQAVATDTSETGTASEARGTARPYMLLDDPVAFDPSGKAAFLDFLARHRGHATIFFSTHDTSLLQAADNAIVLNNGSLVYFGPVQPPEQSAAPAEEVQT